MRRAALAVAVLLAACALPARAALVCQQFTATLAQGTGGGCISITVSQDALWTATNGTTNATATFFGPQPTSTPVGGKLNYVFLAGTNYNLTVTAPDRSSCSGTARITPCTPVCKDIEVNVTATSATSACTVSIGASIFDTSATGFFDIGSLGTTATTALLTAVNGTLLAAPQAYPQGTYTVQAQVNYPNGRTARSDACTITVTDITKYGPPVLNTTNTCFYLNDTKLTNIDIPVTLLASTPAGNKCRNIRVVATACTPEFKNKARTRRLCLPAFSVGSATRPIPATAVDILKKNFQRNPQPITVTLNTFDLNGQLGDASVDTANVVVYRKKPKAAIAANCIPVFNRI